jgi:hypothetical protein
MTMPGNVKSDALTRAPTMFATPNAEQAMPAHRGKDLCQVTRISGAA